MGKINNEQLQPRGNTPYPPSNYNPMAYPGVPTSIDLNDPLPAAPANSPPTPFPYLLERSSTISAPSSTSISSVASSRNLASTKPKPKKSGKEPAIPTELHVLKQIGAAIYRDTYLIDRWYAGGGVATMETAIEGIVATTENIVGKARFDEILAAGAYTRERYIKHLTAQHHYKTVQKLKDTGMEQVNAARAANPNASKNLILHILLHGYSIESEREGATQRVVIAPSTRLPIVYHSLYIEEVIRVLFYEAGTTNTNWMFSPCDLSNLGDIAKKYRDSIPPDVVATAVGLLGGLATIVFDGVKPPAIDGDSLFAVYRDGFRSWYDPNRKERNFAPLWWTTTAAFLRGRYDSDPRINFRSPSVVYDYGFHPPTVPGLDGYVQDLAPPASGSGSFPSLPNSSAEVVGHGFFDCFGSAVESHDQVAGPSAFANSENYDMSETELVNTLFESSNLGY